MQTANLKVPVVTSVGRQDTSLQSTRPPQPPRQGDTQRRKHKTHHVHDEPSDNAQPSDRADSSDGDFKLHRVAKKLSDPIMVALWLNGQKLDMEVDIGTSFSVISETTRQRMFSNETLHHSDLVLKTYTDESMEVRGTLNMWVKYGDQKEKLVLVVVEGNGPSLLGRNWLKYI